MTVRAEAGLPRYFGTGGALFGMYHATAGAPAKAVLLCPPIGQDLVRCHRVYRQLARALAAAGIAAMRFDYYGTGDSAGAGADVDWTHCIADTLAATDELRALSGCRRIAGFGARLGGSIALAAATEACFVELVLWDPVLDGAAHAARLDALQQALRTDGTRFTVPRTAVEVAGQWQGFPVGERLHRQLAGLRMKAGAVPTLVLDTLSAAATGAGPGNTTTIALQPPTPWDNLEHLEDTILAPGLVQAAVARLQGTA